MNDSVRPALGVLLCTQQTSGSLDLDPLRHLLSRYQGKATAEISDALCDDPSVLQTFIRENHLKRVIVGCRNEPFWKSILQEQLVGAGISPANLELFDLKAASENLDRQTKIGAIIELNLRRSLIQPDIPAGNLRRKPLASTGRIERREFLTGRRRATYEIVPTIELERCQSVRNCQECIKTCHYAALQLEDKRIKLIAEKCESCGLCVAACPTNAIVFPNLNPELMAADFATLAEYDRVDGEPRVLVLTCPKRSGEIATTPRGVMPLTVPCGAMLEPSLVMEAIHTGFHGVGLIDCGDDCPHGFQAGYLEEVIQFTQAFLSYCDENPERLQLFLTSSRETESLYQRLNSFRERLMSLGKPIMSIADCEGAFNLRTTFAKAHTLKKGENFEFAAKHLPYGSLELDQSRCTLCGLCGQSCPTDAISIRENIDCELLFNQSRCTACGICVKMCPERAIRVHRKFDLRKFVDESEDRIAMSPRVLCPHCGRPHVPGATVDKVLLRLKRSSAPDAFQQIVMVCEECKGATVMGRATEFSCASKSSQ